MKVGKRDFSPGLLPSILTAVLLSVFIKLGLWQMDRAEQKTQLAESVQERRNASPLMMIGPDAETDKILWRAVELDGEFRQDLHFLLDNQVNKGRAGYFLYSVLEFTDGPDVLVNRGWMAGQGDRTQAPVFMTPQSKVRIMGEIKLPPVTGWLLAENTDERLSDSVIRLQTINIDSIERSYNLDLRAFVLRLKAGSDAGLMLDWPEPGSGVEKHHGYAFQWFAMAAALLIIYLVVNLRKK